MSAKKSTRIADQLEKVILSNITWKWNGSLLYGLSNENNNFTKIASFDMDHTLIKPKGKNKFPINSTDWVWMYPNVRETLINLHKEKWVVVIFSNQGGIGNGKQQSKDITDKIDML